MKTTYTLETKIAVASEFIKDETIKVADIAAKHNVSPRSVCRWKSEFKQQAIDVIKANSKQANEKNNRGFKPRNGRVMVVESVFNKSFFELKTKEQFAIAQKACDDCGLSQLTYPVFMTLRGDYNRKHSI